MVNDREQLDLLGSWVRRRRKALDLTQAALAERVGCAEVTIRKIERNVARPSRETAERLAHCLEIPLEEHALFLQVARGERCVAQLSAPLTNLDSSSPVPALQPTQVLELPLAMIPAPAPLPPGSRMPLSRNPLFVGRDTALHQLARALTIGGMTAIGHLEIAAATGLGGIGKTQLACEFVHRYGQFFPGGVFWLSLADPAVVPAEVAVCGGADAMNLRPEFSTLPLGEQIKLVLAAWASPTPRLLVFDNCEEEELLHQWRPKHGGCRVLVTSRRHHWDPALGVQPVPLDVLPRADSVALLRRFHPDLPADDTDLQAIAETLGDLPLALHLAGNFLAKYRHALTPTQYLARLQAPTILDDRSLREAGLSPTQHVQHVARTFEQSYGQLDPTEPTDALALTLLAHAACFAPGEPLPRWFLLEALELPETAAEQVLLAEDGLTRLIDLGLLDTDEVGNLRLHRLVRAFVQAVLVQATAQAAVESAMLRVAEALNGQRNPLPVLLIQPHLHFVTEAAQPRGDAGSARLANALGYHLYQLGSYREAQGYLEQAVAIRQRVLGADHPDTARSLNSLGGALFEQGQYAAAQDYYEQAFAIRQRVLGTDHPDTARSLNSLGLLSWSQGRYVAAQTYLEQALAIYERVLGTSHLDPAMSLNNLGLALHSQGQYVEAQHYYEQALAIYEQVLGIDHPYTALSLRGLGEVLKDRGQYAAAQTYLEQALAIYERVLGVDHPATARSLRGLGEVLHAQGDTAQARHSVERAFAIFVERLGPRHRDTEQTRQILTALNADRTVDSES